MEAPISPDQQMKPSFLSRIFRRSSPQARTNVSPKGQTEKRVTLPLVSQPKTKMAEAELPKVIERQLNIGTKFLEALKQKVAIIPGEEFESMGATSIKGTNETLDPSLIEKVRSQQEAPNGYIIGIGAGNVVRMLELFPEGKMPKAMILFDIDLDVVREGKKEIEKLRSTSNEDYYRDFYGNSHLHALLPSKFGIKGRKGIDLLLQLAKEGNLVIEQADFTDQRVIDALQELPDRQSFNNVIYLSNISDHEMRKKTEWSNFHGIYYIPNFSFLKKLTPTPPHRNYYVDTVQQSLRYNLRISTKVPEFDQQDFKERRDSSDRLPIKPLDLIE